jgi:uncharacterized oligopeptide transporter (OPT) family protein
MSDAPATTPTATAPSAPPVNGLTPRALISGFCLSLLLCGVNSYLTLSFGVIEEGPTIAALFFFAFFFLSATKINSSEMAIVATMGSAGGSLGFITNFYAAEAMAAEPLSFWQMVGFSVVTSLVGLVFVVPLRQLLILRENLPWPGSKAVESVIRALVEKGDPRQPYILLVTCVTMIAYVVLNDEDGYGLVPSGTEIAIFGLGAYGAAIAWSPFAIGGAYLMGFRTCVGFLFGATALLVLAPHLPEPGAPHHYVWPGIGFLVAAGLTQMALQGKTIALSMKSLFVRGPSASAGPYREGAGPAPSSSDDDDPIMSSRMFAVFTGIALIIAALFSAFGLGLSFVVTVLLIVVGGFLQNVIATRAAAQTAFNPARVMGILLQGVTALAGGTGAGQNLAGAGFVAGSGAQAGVLTGDLAYGRWLRVPSRWQFWTQLVTVVPCSLVSAWVFEQILAQAGGHMTIEGEGLPAPVAKMWAATAQIFSGEVDMPPFAYEAMAIGGAIGCVYVLLEQNEKIEKWLPSSTGVGLGLVLPIAYGWSFFLGGLLFYIAEKRFKVREVSLTTFAVGCIVAEGIGGVLKPLLAVLGLM